MLCALLGEQRMKPSDHAFLLRECRVAPFDRLLLFDYRTFRATFGARRESHCDG
jgi:hypothetical protein